MNTEYLLVVVPDGLRIGKKNKPYLTNTYRNVLKDAFDFSNKNHLKILILPANTFGCNKSEEEVGKNYLIKKGLNHKNIIIGKKEKNSYLDTYDNFREVMINEGEIKKKKFYVSNHLKKGNYILFVSKIHSLRVLKAINLLNLSYPNAIFTSTAIESGHLPKRLIYYKFPKAHKFYEFLAIFYQKIRSSFLSNRYF